MRSFSKLFVAASVVALLANIAGAAPIISDANLLSGLAATPANINVSSVFITGTPGEYTQDNSTDGLGGGSFKDFVFAFNDSDQRLAITGFNSQVATIRIWSNTDLQPSEVTIYSSTTSQTSLLATSYNPLVAQTTSLTWHPGAGAGDEYVEFNVLGPNGTKSLLFDFGTQNGGTGYGGTGFVRIQEIQAFAPEPSSFVLLGLGVAGMFLVARRRRRRA